MNFNLLRSCLYHQVVIVWVLLPLLQLLCNLVIIRHWRTSTCLQELSAIAWYLPGILLLQSLLGEDVFICLPHLVQLVDACINPYLIVAANTVTQVVEAPIILLFLLH